MTRGLKLYIPSIGRTIKLNRDELDDALMALTPGKVFYVNSNASITGLPQGSDSNTGFEWANPLLTIQAGINKCLSGRGDVVVVMGGTGYAENLLLNKSFVTIVGVPAGGYAKPDVVPASGKAFYISAHGVVFMHMRFASPAADTDLALNEANGCKFYDCVLDGDSTQGDTKTLLRLKGKANDDGYTASENWFEDCLFRGSGGWGIAFDVGNGAGNRVGATDNFFRNCRWQDNDKEDVMAVDTDGSGAYSAKNNNFERCQFGLGASKNKATHIDIQTNHGAANTGNTFTDCYINDDNVDATAIKHTGTGSSFIGLHSLDGEIGTDTFD